MNKKGAWGDLKNIILALVFGIILLLFTLYLSGGLSDSGSKAACKNWVNMQSSAKIEGFELASFKNPCPTLEDNIEINDKEKIYETLAKSIYDCWDMYGRGEKDFYSDWDFGKSDTHCMICSEIIVDEKVTKKRPSIDLDDFEIYLSNNNPPNHGETYSELFLGAKHADFGIGELPLDKNIYVLYIVNKKGDWSFYGIMDKYLFKPVTVIAGGSFIPGAKGLTKGLGGVFQKVTKGGGKTVWGLAIVYASTVGVVSLADGSVLYPSLSIISYDSHNINECSDIHYNPQKKLFEGFGKGESGGAGAERGYE